MKLTRVLLPAALCTVLAVACGGGDDAISSDAPDLSKVPTATLPAELPTPRVIGEGAVQPGGGSTYTVRSGDTLAAIAERFGLSLDELVAANPGLDPRALTVGDSVRLPELSGTPRPATEEATATAAQTPADTATPAPVVTEAPESTSTPVAVGQTYTVQSGDIPETIAARFGITVEALLAANPGVSPTGLQVGQVLNIPPPPASD